MCGKNSTTTSTNTPNPVALGAYNSLIGQAQNVAQLPFQQYGGEFTAPVNQQEQLAGQNINANAGFAQPYIQEAAQYANQAAQPITAQQIQNYENPYINQVVGATEAQFNQQNEQQQQQLTGNAAAQGALGGNRVGLAQATLAGQQQLQEAPTIAGLYSQGYSQAEQEALAEQQQQAQAAYSLGNLGVAGQNAALQGAGAQLGYGQLGQQTQQAQDTALYNQFLAQQGYPFQTLGWLAGLDTGVGSQMGGTNVTQGPQPNPFSSLLGAGMLGLGIYNAVKDGGRVTGRNDGGRIANCGRRIAGFAMGGSPYSSLDDDAAAGYVPSVQLQIGNTMPKGPSGSGQQQQNPLQQSQQLLGLGKTAGIFGNNGGNGDVGTFGAQMAGIGSGLSPDEVGLGDLGAFRQGGRIAGFAGGGSPDMDYADGGDDQLGFVGPSDGGGGSGRPTMDEEIAQLRNGTWKPTPDYQQGLALAQPSLENPPPGGDTLAGPGSTYSQVMEGAPSAPLPERAAGYSDDNYTGVGLQAPQSQEQPQQKGFLDKLFGGHNPQLGQSLMAAGLGMMASRSPYLGNAIGEGGLAGLQAYQAGNKREFDENIAVKKLQQNADQHAKQLELETKKLQQGEEGLEIRRGQLEHGKFQMVAGLGPDPNDPEKQVSGAYRFNTKTGDQQFVPGVNLTQKGSATSAASMSPQAIEISARQLINGDLSGLTNVGRGAQGSQLLAAIRSRAAELLTDPDGEYKYSPQQAAQYLGDMTQGFRANQVGQSAGARTASTRAANLGIILDVANAAVPNALSLSDQVYRYTGFVPLDRIIQNGQVMTNDPVMNRFAVANLQLAESWAKAMNPTGVMRESDRDIALHMLSTAKSPEAYKAVVNQIKDNIDREMEGVRTFQRGAPGSRPTSGGPAPAPAAAPAASPAAPPGPANLPGGRPAPNLPPRVRQNGHIFERQPDGSMRDMGPG